MSGEDELVVMSFAEVVDEAVDLIHAHVGSRQGNEVAARLQVAATRLLAAIEDTAALEAAINDDGDLFRVLGALGAWGERLTSRVENAGARLEQGS